MNRSIYNTYSRRTRLALAIIASTIMVLDNTTTIFAISHGAHEINPIVKLFLSSTPSWILFTAVKMAIAFALTYMFVKTKIDLIIWLAVMAFFINAIITNLVNAFA